ncbi:hypothetical protein [Haloferax sp. YSMS24]|uniref:hypothetical protein n=1 Tax=unclassified Haloferax TaxID=2625095 RepID=UPI00398C8797
MSRRIAVLAVAVTVLLATFGAPLALASPTSPAAPAFADDDGRAPAADDETAANSTNETPPGQKLSGVIGVQASETDGELERRTFETRLAKANSNASKAAVVAGQVDTIRDRLTALQQEKQRLEEAHENGSLPDGAYRVKMTRTVADIERTKSMLNQTSDAAADIPAEDLREKGVDTAELDRLRGSANELAGPEVAAIARDLAGENPGKGLEKAKKDRKSGNETADADRNGNDSDASSEHSSGNGNGDNAGSANENSSRDTKDSSPNDRAGTENRPSDLLTFEFTTIVGW